MLFNFTNLQLFKRIASAIFSRSSTLVKLYFLLFLQKILDLTQFKSFYKIDYIC